MQRRAIFIRTLLAPNSGLDHVYVRCPQYGDVREASSRTLCSPHPSVSVPDLPFAQVMFAAMARYKDETALVDFLSGRRWTFRQVIEEARRVASGLTRLGLRQGDTLLMFASNSPEYALVLLACAACGIIVSTANPTYTAEELGQQLQGSDSTAAVAGQEQVAVLERAGHGLKLKIVLGQAHGYVPFSCLREDSGTAFPSDVTIRPAEDVLFLPFSSGTTGRPKGVMLTHRNVLVNIVQQQGWSVGVRGEGRVLGVLPFYHIYGLVMSLWTALYQGNVVVTLPRFQPQTFLQAVSRWQVSVLHLVPPLVMLLAREGAVLERDLACVHKVICGAAPLGEGLSRQFSQHSDALLMQAYGMTEASPVTHLDIPPIRMGTIGHVISSTEAKVVDVETGETLGPGQLGELCVRGPQLMKGYYKNPQATADTIRDGWLHTGDLGQYDDEGYFTVKDRLKELIKYKGFQVAPAELEAELLTHPAVADCAVVGVEDAEAGEVPRAFVVARPGQQLVEGDVLRFLHGRVAPHKKLRGGLVVVDHIPKTASGKILRRVLRQNLVIV